MYKIYRVGQKDTLKFASQELAKYLTLITQEDVFEIEESCNEQKDKEGLWLGENIAEEIFNVENSKLDDAIAIEIKNGKGYITGSNARSVLIGVYKFLEEIGCKWLRPGEGGEVIPYKKLYTMNVSLKEKAALRHRGIVIEGANSYQNVLDMIEWMPKLGYNSYFIQFKHAYSFFKQWYSHTENPFKFKEFFNNEMAIEFTNEIKRALKKRGLIYHAVGHGWTTEAIGIEGRGWEVEKDRLSETQREYLACIKGKREFREGVPLNTNLCYSNKCVQEIFVKAIVAYAKKNADVDILHVWLADEYNNHCECDQCKKFTPTEWYIKLLNQLDEALTQEKITTQIVFLLYFELLWPPIKENLNHPERFIMMFAPISRTFTTSYSEARKEEITLPPFCLNNIKLPHKLEENLQFLKEWQKYFKGDSFDFDYHLGRAHYGDAGYYKIAKVIVEDIKSLHSLGLNGLMSCQQQRTFFPTALPNYAMGKTLWNTQVDFEELAETYFKFAFGEDWKQVINYLMQVSEVFDMGYWHLAQGGVDLAFAQRLEKVPNVIAQFKEVILKNQEHVSKVEKTSWKYLYYHLEYTKLFAAALSAKARGEEKLANERWTIFADYICYHEEVLQPVLDVYRILMIGRIFSHFKRKNG